MTSTRLPGKVLIEAGGRSLLGHHLDRLAATDLDIIVATTTNPSDDPIVAAAEAHGATVFRGSEHDVLARFAGAASTAHLDTVIRVTSDCPLIDPELILQGLARYEDLEDPRAHVSNVLVRTFPRGFDFEVFSAAALREADECADRPAEREHVTPYLYNDRSGRTRLHAVTQTRDASGYRVTVDTEDDLVLVRALIERHRAAALDAAEIIGVLDAHPELAQINAHIEQKKLGE